MLSFNALVFLSNVSFLSGREKGRLRGNFELRGVVIDHGCATDTASALCLILHFHLADYFLRQVDEDAHFVYHVDIRPFQVVLNNHAFVRVALFQTLVLVLVVYIRILLG